MISNYGDFLASVFGKDEDVKMLSGFKGCFYIFQLRRTQKICKLPLKSTSLSSPGLGMVDFACVAVLIDVIAA